MKGVNRSVSHALKLRNYAAQAQVSSAEAPRTSPVPKNQVQVTKWSNGVVVATLENHSPIARLSFCYNAGSKHETGINRGISHVLRNAAGNLSTKNISAFGLVKRIQQVGGSLSCTTDREHMTYTLECLRSHADDALYYLGELATQPVFKPWEVDALVPRHSQDVAALSTRPELQVLEAVHKAAYRNGGLGNSIYMDKDRVGSHTPKLMEDFCRAYLTPINLCVVGVGMNHEQLLHDLKKLDFGTNISAPKHVPSTFLGGEVRVETSSNQVHVAMVNEGIKLGSPDLLTVGVLQRLMGCGPLVKHASNTNNSRIGAAITRAARHPVAASCINMSYSESGLFGFQTIVHAAEVAPVLQSIIKSFSDVTKGNFSDEDIKVAKAQLRSAILFEYEDQESMIQDLDVTSLKSGDVSDTSSMVDRLDKITGEDISQLAKKLLNSKPAMAAIGDLTCTPYMDELV